MLAHFRKDPANLPIRWEQYHNEFVHRVENTQIRLANGCQITEATATEPNHPPTGCNGGSTPGNESCGGGGPCGWAGTSSRSGYLKKLLGVWKVLNLLRTYPLVKILTANPLPGTMTLPPRNPKELLGVWNQ